MFHDLLVASQRAMPEKTPPRECSDPSPPADGSSWDGSSLSRSISEWSKPHLTDRTMQASPFLGTPTDLLLDLLDRP